MGFGGFDPAMLEGMRRRPQDTLENMGNRFAGNIAGGGFAGKGNFGGGFLGPLLNKGLGRMTGMSPNMGMAGPGANAAGPSGPLGIMDKMKMGGNFPFSKRKKRLAQAGGLPTGIDRMISGGGRPPGGRMNMY